MALVDGFAMGSGLALSAACDLRVCTPAAKFGLPIARTVGNCLSMENYARLAALLGPARLKDIIFTARTIEAEEALAIGLATEVVEADRAEARVEALCELLASHAPVTLRVTKEALRRIRSATTPDGDDLVREAYGSEGFRRNVAAFLARSAPRQGMTPTRERGRGWRPRDDADFAVAAQTRIAARNRERERKAEKRARRERILLWLCAPLLLPAAGAAAALAILDRAGGDLQRLVGRVGRAPHRRRLRPPRRAERVAGAPARPGRAARLGGDHAARRDRAGVLGRADRARPRARR